MDIARSETFGATARAAVCATDAAISVATTSFTAGLAAFADEESTIGLEADAEISSCGPR